MDEKKKIILVLLPYWTPLLPPVGIASLKANVKNKDNFNIRVVDANIDVNFTYLRERFYSIVKKTIPSDTWGNFYSTSNNLLANLLIMYAYVEKDKADKHIREYLAKTFFYQVEEIGEYKNVLDKMHLYLEEYIINLIECEKADYIGLSLFKGNLGLSLKCLEIIGRKYSNIKTVVGGGVFANDLSINSKNYEYFITRNKIDKIIIGEGELLFNKVLDEIDSEKKVYTLDEMNGQFNINDAVNPDYDDYQLKSYPYIGVYGSRSCPCQCSFCSETLHWGGYRHKQSEKIVNEMLDLNARYSKRLFLFCDSLLNPIIDDLSELLLKSDIQLYYDGYLRADENVTFKEKAKLWRKSGFYRARIGMESGSQKILNAMSKNITISQMKKVLINLSDMGIKTTTYWLVGYPGETEKDFQDTLNFIKEMKDYIYEAECNAFTYYETGQTLSNTYKKQGNISGIFKDDMEEVPFINWQADVAPDRKAVHERIVCFTQLCQELGVSNPYTMAEIVKADKRWSSLHFNSVPTILEFI